MGYLVASERGWLDALPSTEGFVQVRTVLREALAGAMGE